MAMLCSGCNRVGTYDGSWSWSPAPNNLSPSEHSALQAGTCPTCHDKHLIELRYQAVRQHDPDPFSKLYYDSGEKFWAPKKEGI